MENIGKITARLEADAQREIEAINAEAAEKIAAIKAEYDKKAQDMLPEPFLFACGRWDLNPHDLRPQDP